MDNFPDDNVLIFNIRQNNDDEAMNMLATRYLSLFHKLVSHQKAIFECKSLDSDDFIVVYFKTLKKTIKSYDPLQGEYCSYLYRVLTRDISKAMIEKISSIDATNTFLSLDDKVGDDLKLIDIIEDQNELLPSDYMNLTEARLMLRSTTKTEYKDDEKLKANIINMRIFGFTIQEIAKTLKISFSKVRRILTSYQEENYDKIAIRLK